MTQLINTTTKQVITSHEFLALHPNTSFGPVINYSDYGFEVVFDTPQPTVTDLQVVVQGSPVLTTKGHWEQTWTVQDKFQDKVDEQGLVIPKASQEAEYLTKLADEKKQANNAKIFTQIAELESKQPRAVREALLKLDGAIERLAVIENDIALLRTQIVL